jgi:excisionase family DNA binding protein
MRGVAEISEFLGLSRDEIARLLRMGRLPAFKVGQGWWMRQSTYLEWIECLEASSPSVSNNERDSADDREHADDHHRDEETGNLGSGQHEQTFLTDGGVRYWLSGAEGHREGDEEIATFPPGRYYQKTLADGRVRLWRRGSASPAVTARERRFREVDERRRVGAENGGQRYSFDLSGKC